MSKASPFLVAERSEARKLSARALVPKVSKNFLPAKVPGPRGDQAE